MKKVYYLLAFIVVFLAACTTATPAPQEVLAPTAVELPTAIPTDPPTNIPSPTATQVMEANTDVSTSTEFAGLETMPGCTIVSGAVDPDPTIASLFPAVHEGDQVIGKSDAAVTIVEYGDFQ